MSDTEPQVKPANLLKAGECEFEYRQRTDPENSNLELLSMGTYPGPFVMLMNTIILSV